MNASLFLATSFVLALLGILAYTIWYRESKRLMRKCRNILPSGRVCVCDPRRIGQIYQMVQPSGTDPLFDGTKVLALVLARCQVTGDTIIAKHEQKHIHPISRRWKMFMEPVAYRPNIEFLLSVRDPVTVVQMLELIRLSNGKDATTLLDGILPDPQSVPQHYMDLRDVVGRRRKARRDKDGIGPLKSPRPLQGLLV